MIAIVITIVGALCLIAGAMSGKALGHEYAPLVIMPIDCAAALLPGVCVALRRTRRSIYFDVVIGLLCLFILMFTFVSHCESFATWTSRGPFGRRIAIVVTGFGWAAAMAMLVAAARKGRDGVSDLLQASALGIASPVLFFVVAIAVIYGPLAMHVSIPWVATLLIVVAVGPVCELLAGEISTAAARASSSPTPPQLQTISDDVARRLGVPKCAVIVSPRVSNAAVVHRLMSGPAVVMNPAFLSSLSSGELEAVIAHELAHIKQRHVPLLLFLSLCLTAVAAFGFALTNQPVAALSATRLAVVFVIIATKQLVQLAFRRRFELQADQLASTVVGVDNVAAAIRATKLAGIEPGPGGTHPSSKDRIARLDSNR